MEDRHPPKKYTSKNVGTMISAENLTILQQQLEQLYFANQTKTSSQWKRTLPFSDYLVDRWKKAEILGFGKGTSIYDSAMIFGDVEVGRNTWIGPNTILDGSGGLTIGDNCSISAGVQVYSHDSVQWALSGGQEQVEKKTTTIGSNCYLGPNVIVTKGVTIGDNCVIGANSLVLTNIPVGSKAHGTPCQITGKSHGNE